MASSFKVVYGELGYGKTFMYPTLSDYIWWEVIYPKFRLMQHISMLDGDNDE